MCRYCRCQLALSTVTSPSPDCTNMKKIRRLHIRLQGFGSNVLLRSNLGHFKFDCSSLREQHRVAQLESVGGAEARPSLSEGAKPLLHDCARSTLHHRSGHRASEIVPHSIELLMSVFAPVRHWDVLRPPKSSSHGIEMKALSKLTTTTERRCSQESPKLATCCRNKKQLENQLTIQLDAHFFTCVFRSFFSKCGQASPQTSWTPGRGE